MNFKEPFLFRLVPLLSLQLREVFPELHAQQDYVSKVVHEEEISFLRTLENGISLINDELTWRKLFLEKFIGNRGVLFQGSIGDMINEAGKDVNVNVLQAAMLSSIDTRPSNREIIQLIDRLEYSQAFESINSYIKTIPGYLVFELYDTFGFPLDLTSLISKEEGFLIDEKGFAEEMDKQKARSKADAKKETGDWVTIEDEKIELVSDDPRYYDKDNAFIGYDKSEHKTQIIKTRSVVKKGEEFLEIVLKKTPFYGESGGQVGDTGFIALTNGTKLDVLDTKKENGLTVHYVKAKSSGLPNITADLTSDVLASVNVPRRKLIMSNHSATHLLHAALRQVLGKHVEQKGSLVNEKILRFDFSHFAAMSKEEIFEVEKIVNEKIRENIQLNEQRNVPIEKAKSLGAMALFGEKYGDFVRVITFDPKFSVELCGGTHVKATGNIGLLKIISESSVAAGVRRIEAVTAAGAQEYMNQSLAVLNEVKTLLKNPKDVVASVQTLAEEKHALEKKLEIIYQQQANVLKDVLATKAIKLSDYTLINERVVVPNADALKNIAYALRNQFDDLLMILAAEVDGKPQVAVMLGEKLEANKKFHAGNMVKELAKEIDGGGGGQSFFATAGGKNLGGLDAVLIKAKQLIL